MGRRDTKLRTEREQRQLKAALAKRKRERLKEQAARARGEIPPDTTRVAVGLWNKLYPDKPFNPFVRQFPEDTIDQQYTEAKVQ